MTRVDDAMRHVDRRWFLPERERHRAGHDGPIPIGHGATNSQPATVRVMLELLDVAPGQRVLDVGAGSGWTTALLAHLVRPGGEVVGVELEPDLVGFGNANLVAAGYAPLIRPADGDQHGCPELAPYHRILVSAMPAVLPTELVDQLLPGGVMVIPVNGDMLRVQAPGISGQPSGPVVTRHGKFRFVPLR